MKDSHSQVAPPAADKPPSYVQNSSSVDADLSKKYPTLGSPDAPTASRLKTVKKERFLAFGLNYDVKNNSLYLPSFTDAALELLESNAKSE